MQNSDSWNIIWMDEVDSTSAVIRRDLANMLSFSAIAAVSQTAGRGQGDHKWHSVAGENLTFSIFVRYDGYHVLSATDQVLLTMASSVAVARYLERFGIEASIKKPNDVYAGEKKICGMLIENGLAGQAMNWSIVGIGLNINQTVFPSDLPNPVSVRQLTGEQYNIRQCLEDLLDVWRKHYEMIWEDRDALVNEYESRIISWQRQ